MYMYRDRLPKDHMHVTRLGKLAAVEFGVDVCRKCGTVKK